MVNTKNQTSIEASLTSPTLNKQPNSQQIPGGTNPVDKEFIDSCASIGVIGGKARQLADTPMREIKIKKRPGKKTRRQKTTLPKDEVTEEQ